MEVYKRFRLFGLYFYVSSVRMKRRRRKDEQMRNRRKELQRMKVILYRRQCGCCAMCGRRFVKEALEIHHLIGISEAPGLALTQRNLQLLCHDCHVRVHQEARRED